MTKKTKTKTAKTYRVVARHIKWRPTKRSKQRVADAGDLVEGLPDSARKWLLDKGAIVPAEPDETKEQ